MDGNLSQQQFAPGSSVTKLGAMAMTKKFEGPSPLGGDSAPAPAEVRTCPDVPAAEPPIFRSPKNLLLVVEVLPNVFSLVTEEDEGAAS